MTDIMQGTVTVSIPEGITIPERAGTLSPDEVQRLPRARHGVGLTCEATADAMAKNADRLCPHNVDANSLIEKGKMAEAIDRVIVDTENALTKLKQANLILDADAHEALRKVLAFVRGQEKFDPRITDLVPALESYFSSDRPKGDSSNQQDAS